MRTNEALRAGANGISICELCFTEWRGAATLGCPKCNLELEGWIGQRLRKIEKQATARACRSCGGELSASRYFQCNKCLGALPSEMPYEEHMDNLAGATCAKDFAQQAAARKSAPVAVVIPLKKLCPTCEQLKCSTEFAKNSGRPDGLFYRCKACDNQRFRKLYRERRRHRLSEVPQQGDELAEGLESAA